MTSPEPTASSNTNLIFPAMSPALFVPASKLPASILIIRLKVRDLNSVPFIIINAIALTNEVFPLPGSPIIITFSLEELLKVCDISFISFSLPTILLKYPFLAFSVKSSETASRFGVTLPVSPLLTPPIFGITKSSCHKNILDRASLFETTHFTASSISASEDEK